MISFKWRHFEKDLILLAVRWYVAYSLSYRNLEEMMRERGVPVDHSTINRWVVHYSPLLEEIFRKKQKPKPGKSWRMDETYIKVKGAWCYLYRAVDKEGATIDFMLSKNRDKPAAKAFFDKAIGANGLPEKVNMDKSGANKAGIDAVNFQLMIFMLLGFSINFITVRQVKYLNNRIEQDHRGMKRMTDPMMGFKTFRTASATIAGIELHHMLKKGQHINSANLPVFEQFYV